MPVMRLRTHTPKLADDGVDVALLRKTARHIEKNPENYDQQVYFASDATREGEDFEAVMQTKAITGPECHTVACVAGTAVLLSGRLPDFTWGGRGSVDWHGGGKTVLGIDESLAEWLFAGDRDKEAMPTILRAIADGERRRWTLRDIEEGAESIE